MNHITLTYPEIPSEFIDLAGEWYCGQSDMLYALSSSGGLTLGNRRPLNDDGAPSTEQEWHVHLWSMLECDVRYSRKAAEKTSHEDLNALLRFEAFCEETVQSLRTAYGMEV